MNTRKPWTVGTHYGHWQIIDNTLIDQRILAHCTLCNKTTKLVRRASLGTTSNSCGCQPTHPNPNKGKKWTLTTPPPTQQHRNPQPGDTYGRLTITGNPIPASRKHNRRNRTIQATCQCGTTKTYPITHLNTGRIKSCGCYKTDGLRNLNNPH